MIRFVEQLALTLDQSAIVLERAIVETARLSGTLSERAPEISSLIGNANAAFGALGRQRTALAESVQRLPDFMRLFNTTAVNLRASLDDLDPLVEASKPAVRELGPFFREFGQGRAHEHPQALVRRADHRTLVGRHALIMP